MIVRLSADLVEPDSEQLGGKGAGLARLMALGLPVPPTVVIPASDDGRIDDPDGLVAALGEALAVRSSAVGEDGTDRSAAGQYESVLGVRADELPLRIREVLRSASSPRVLAYRGEAVPMAVVIQRHLAASRSGVAFSRHPITGDAEVVLECVFGPGEALVSGTATPDRYTVGVDGTVGARVAVRTGALATVRTLRDDEARAVADLTRRAEDGFGDPVDVEFCFEGPDLWLVQCRAITTLGGQ
jgi:pyruvate,water dikinase